MSRLVLLTGATGFVGRQVLRHLLASDVAVRLVVRTGSEKEFKGDARLDSVLTTDDLFAEPQDWWQSAFEGVDTILHVAWYAEPGKYVTSFRNLDCLKGSLVMGNAAVAAGVRRFVGVGTCFEYDVSKGDLATDTDLLADSPYAACKIATFLALNGCLPRNGVEFAWCRLFYLYGDREDARRLIPYIHSRLTAGKSADLTDGSQIRDYIDVAKAGRMIAETALAGTVGPVNICSGVGTTIRELAENVADQYGRRDLLNFGAKAANPNDPPYIVGVRPQTQHQETTTIRARN